jgi:hypothetical protein
MPFIAADNRAGHLNPKSIQGKAHPLEIDVVPVYVRGWKLAMLSGRSFRSGTSIALLISSKK